EAPRARALHARLADEGAAAAPAPLIRCVRRNLSARELASSRDLVPPVMVQLTGFADFKSQNSVACAVLMGMVATAVAPPLPPKPEGREMQTAVNATPINDGRYGRCLENSRRIRWDIDKDVIRGREFDYSGLFLPDGLSMISRLGFLSAADARL